MGGWAKHSPAFRMAPAGEQEAKNADQTPECRHHDDRDGLIHHDCVQCSISEFEYALRSQRGGRAVGRLFSRF